MPQRIGLISDTHGLLRPAAREFLRGCDRIIHGGDIGSSAILEALSQIAPTTAVRGNNDKGSWADALPQTERVRCGNVNLYAIHDIAQLDIDPRADGVQVVVHGHSHRPQVQRKGDVLYVNPGSAGPRRFRLPIGIAELVVDGTTITPRLVEIDDL
jgi:putative phosphoesterase